ncbi:hypothetical protein [Streptomyces glaucescens]|uniref:Large membrane protein n=1 Tax=Streptomyces glaucescens TaxID=1907 RepID=A0A089XA39_STRGA|nr:hypothetical protein [Streptomyces glaucescens]AIR97979.1 large membrane protein [Streptomyces glaucescens]
MNTERPENDDEVVGESGAAEGAAADASASRETAPDNGKAAPEAEGAAGAETAPGTEGTPQAEAAPEAEGAAGAGAAPEAEGAREAGSVAGSREGPAAERARAEPPSGRRSPALVAAVAAAVLLAGGGGAYLAASAGGGTGAGTGSGAPGGNGTPPPLALDGYAEGAGNGIAPGEPDPNGVTYRASGALPEGPGSAPVYWAKGEVTEAEVTRLAAALGVDGTPVAEGQAWKAGSGKDGQGPSLQVNRRAPGTWTFHRYAPGTDDCESVTVCAKAPASPSVDPVGEAAARKAAAPVLKALGQDSARVDASRVNGADRVVTADPVVGGLPTYGWPTGLTVGAQGEVVTGSGQLKAPVKGATYPVLDARRTLDRLNAAQEPGRRAGIGGCASPVPLGDDRAQAPCGTSAAGEGRREAVVVERAVFGLASHFVDARQTLVPSWLFEVRAPGAAEGFTVTYPAVDPRYLASPAPSGATGGDPSPRPTGPEEPAQERKVAVEGYTAEGDELTVAFTGGVCADYTATATESADRVTVTVTEKPWPDKVCIMIAKVHHRTVRLDEPLGDRKVVGPDGEAVPLEKPGARLPR